MTKAADSLVLSIVGTFNKLVCFLVIKSVWVPIGATFESKTVKQLFKNYKRFECTVMQLSYFIF